MPYLLQHVRRPATALPHPRARVDEKLRLNRPGLHGDAYVRVHVENTQKRRRKSRRDPKFVLKIADCMNVIALEFSVADDVNRENSLFKIDTLLGSLHRFRDAFAAEAELAEWRQNG